MVGIGNLIMGNGIAAALANPYRVGPSVNHTYVVDTIVRDDVSAGDFIQVVGILGLTDLHRASAKISHFVSHNANSPASLAKLNGELTEVLENRALNNDGSSVRGLHRCRKAKPSLNVRITIRGHRPIGVAQREPLEANVMDGIERERRTIWETVAPGASLTAH